MGRDDYLLTNTPTANIYLYEENGKKRVYKKFHTPLSMIDKSRYDAFISIKSEYVVLPEELVIEDGFISGYTSKYIDGVVLEDNVDKIDLRSLIAGIKKLGEEYDELADKGITVSDVNLMNLIYSNGYVYNIDTDGFKVLNNPNKMVFKLKNNMALKQACFTILANNLMLTSDIRTSIDKDMKKFSISAADMLNNFKKFIEIKYNMEFDNISKVRNEIGGLSDNNDSWAYRSR